MLPDQRVRCSGCSRRIERSVTLLLEPDSPRMPSVRMPRTRHAHVAGHGLEPGLRQRRLDAGTNVFRERAARAEPAARRRVDGVGRIALDRRLVGPLARIHRRPRRQERAGIGMLRIAVDRLDRAQLDDLAEIHDQHAVAEVLHDVEVVADEDVGEIELRLEVDQHVQDLRLDRLVERRHRLVEDDQSGPQRKRPRDVHALSLAARQFVRIAGGIACRVEADLAQEVAHALACFGRRQPVRPGREGQRLGDRQTRIERGVGILEHHLHLPAQLVDGDAVRFVDRIAVQHHRAPVGLDQADQQPCHRRLAATRLAHDAQRFALGDRQGEIVDRAHDLGGASQKPARDREMLAQAGGQQQGLSRPAAILDRKQRVHVRPSHPWPRADHRSSG